LKFKKLMVASATAMSVFTGDVTMSTASFALGSPQSAQTGTERVLQDGTPVRLRIKRTVSSADARMGDNVDFEVLDEIKVADVVVVPKGGLALGTVTQVEQKKRMGRGGKLNINIDHVRLIDGE